MAATDATPEPPAAAAGLRELLGRARRGDASCLPELRRALDDHPELWLHAGDLAAHAERAWIAAAAGPDLLLSESLARRLAALKAELAAAGASPPERLLVDRVAITWLRAAYSDEAAARARDAPPRLAESARRRQEAAHRAHLAAISALAQARRILAAPSPGARPPARPGTPLALFDGPPGPEPA